MASIVFAEVCLRRNFDGACPGQRPLRLRGVIAFGAYIALGGSATAVGILEVAEGFGVENTLPEEGITEAAVGNFAELTVVDKDLALRVGNLQIGKLAHADLASRFIHAEEALLTTKPYLKNHKAAHKIFNPTETVRDSWWRILIMTDEESRRMQEEWPKELEEAEEEEEKDGADDPPAR